MSIALDVHEVAGLTAYHAAGKAVAILRYINERCADTLAKLGEWWAEEVADRGIEKDIIAHTGKVKRVHQTVEWVDA